MTILSKDSKKTAKINMTIQLESNIIKVKFYNVMEVLCLIIKKGNSLFKKLIGSVFLVSKKTDLWWN